MTVIVSLFLLLVGFVLLIKGADFFVDGSVQMATRLKVPKIIIGLTIVSLGTSAPEIVVTVTSALAGTSSMAIGNVLGSNLFNLLMVLGICSVVTPFAVNFKEVSRDFWISVAAAVALLFMQLLFYDYIPRLGGVLFLLGFCLYMVVLVKETLKKQAQNEAYAKSMRSADGPAPEQQQMDEDEKKMSIVKTAFYLLGGLAAIIIGGQVTVDQAVTLAQLFGLSERVIGLTVLAIGTSLPELVTTLVAFKKGAQEVAIGNIIGSNIFNIILILGLSATLTPLAVDRSVMGDIVMVIVASLLVMVFAKSKKGFVRWEGLTITALYFLYMGYTIFV